MQKITITFIACLILLNNNIMAQSEEPILGRLKIGVELGSHYMNSNMETPSQVRQANLYYDKYDSYRRLGYYYRNVINATYFTLKPEYQLTERFSVASGFRLSFYKDQFDANYNYFLWQIKGDQNNTNYLKIARIEQTVYKLGIPLEFRLYPRRRDHFVRQYFLVGAMFNFATFTDTDIDTYNEFADRYEDSVKETLTRPDNFSSFYYAGIGLKIGKVGYPSANFEVLFPMVSFGEYMISSFSKSSGTGVIGIATSLKIPIAL